MYIRKYIFHVQTFCALLACLAFAEDSNQAATRILEQAGTKAGLIVHLNCGDGKLAGALRRKGRFVVHGLDRDLGNVRRARASVLAAGQCGPVSFAQWVDTTRLPYIDNTVNLLLADDLGTTPQKEIMRVLVPKGVALINGKKTIKPLAKGHDEWNHYLRGPDNNAVSADPRIAPPRRLQWQCGPKWPRHHDHMSSTSAVVSANGRIFYIMDEGLTATMYAPSHWALIARDAYNGKLIWKRQIKNWFTRFKGLKDGPADVPRRLVAVGDQVYVTLGLRSPVLCLDAATGKTVHQYAETKEAEEILVDKGTLYVLCGTGSIGDGGRKIRPPEKRTIVALDAKSGRKLWSAAGAVAALTPALNQERLFYLDITRKKIVALDRKTGKQSWVSNEVPVPSKQFSFFASKLVATPGVVLLASGESSGLVKSGGGARKADALTAVNAETGKTLWTAKHAPSGYSSPEDLFVIGDGVWSGNTSSGGSDGTHVCLDLKTGKEKKRFAADRTSYWFHHRCYSGRASVNYIMTSRTGIEFIDIKTGKWDLNHWVRGPCLYGIMPANGLIYTPPAPCICYAETYLHSFNAYAPAAPVAEQKTEGARLLKGPAFGKAVKANPLAHDWPTYRSSNARHGATAGKTPAALDERWSVKLVEGKLSSPVVAEGMLFVTAIDAHTVFARDAASGKARWQFTAGARIDSPPTITGGRVVFGSNDGYVYCLRAADGALIWRFRAAPTDRRLLVYEQLESSWPVHGSVLVREGIVHFIAGRSAFVDGGLRFYRLNVDSGEVVSETKIDHINPKTGKDLHDTVKWLNMAVARPDVLSCDGDRIYMRSQAFDLQGKRLLVGPVMRGREEGTRQGGEGTHLFCPTGFLDDTWFHRTYWLYGKSWSSGWNGYFVAGQFAAGGKIICVDDDRVFVFGRHPKYYRWTTPMEFRLFAAKKEWIAGKQKPAPKEKPADKKNPKRRRGQRNLRGPVINPANYFWTTNVPIVVQAMAVGGLGKDRTLLIAGPPDILDESGLKKSIGNKQAQATRQEAAFRGKSGGLLWAISTADGKPRAKSKLPSPPVFDGMIIANGNVYVATMDGKVTCLGDD